MVRFETFDDVLRAVPKLLAARVDALEYLQRPGVLSEKLLADLKAAAHPKPPPRRIRSQVTTGPLPRLVRDKSQRSAPAVLPRGGYHLRVALRVELASETLGGLYATHEISHRLPGSDLQSIFGPTPLRTVMTGIPDGVSIGDVHITSAPRVELAESVEHAILVLPLRVDFVARMPGPIPRQRVVTHLSATLRLVAELAVEVRSVDGVEGAVLAFPFGEPPRIPGAARFTVDPDSPVQPIAEGLVDDYFLDRDALLRQGLSLAFGSGVAIGSPIIAIPGLDDITLKLVRGDVRANQPSSCLNLGLLLSIDGEALDPDVGDPRTLEQSLLTRGNVEAFAHSALVDKIARAALRSGRLQAFADAAADAAQPGISAEVTDAWGAIDTEGIKIRIGLRLSGICAAPLNVVYAIDLKPSVENGQLVVSRSEEWQGIGAWEVVVCILSGLGSIGIGIVVPLFRGLWALGEWALDGFPLGDEPAPFVTSALFESPRPIPGTELRPQVEVLTSFLNTDHLNSSGELALLRDTLNTYVYAIFHDVSSDPINPARTPIARATIRLNDQDWPPPPNDELPTVPVVEQGDSFVVTQVLEVFRGTTDQNLASAKTTSAGRVRFVLSPRDMLTRWGNARMRRTFTNRVTGATFSTPPFVGPINEVAPDLYFVIEREQGSTSRTSMSPIVDVRPGERVGTADEPLRYDFGGPVFDL